MPRESGPEGTLNRTIRNHRFFHNGNNFVENCRNLGKCAADRQG
jgi:hypothetical protein